jgi:hypothetical protein
MFPKAAHRALGNQLLLLLYAQCGNVATIHA